MEKLKKLQQENKQLKELQKSQDFVIQKSIEAIEANNECMQDIIEENKSLLSSKLKLETLENKILEEYFFNTALDRKRTEQEFKNKTQKDMMILTSIDKGIPFFTEIIKMFIKPKQDNKPPKNGCASHEPINFNKD